MNWPSSSYYKQIIDEYSHFVYLAFIDLNINSHHFVFGSVKVLMVFNVPKIMEKF